jgi:hypothetical protein
MTHELGMADLTAGFSSLTAGGHSPIATGSENQERIGIGSSSQERGVDEDDDDDELVPGDPFDKWDMKSVERAMTGDKSGRRPDYR